MQDIYAFDVGDFGKLGLLSAIHRVAGLPIGVLWWKTTLGTNGQDGRHVRYLEDPSYRGCDPELWEAMRVSFRCGPRTITALHALLPGSTRFHSEPVPFPGQRKLWLQAAIQSVRGSEVIFCDPDNGIRFDGDSYSPRHVALDEVRVLYSAGCSLVLYHTPGRSESHAQQIRVALGRFAEEIPRIGGLSAAHFRRGSSRAFLILAQPRHVEAFEQILETLRLSPWVAEGHFDIIRKDLTPASPESPEPLTAPSHGGMRRPPESARINEGKGPVGTADAGALERVRVVLNDNGGLNAAANPWLWQVHLPCSVALNGANGSSFVVEATFRGRTDMFRVSPSTLTVARWCGFTRAHLSWAHPVEFEAVIRATRSS